MTSTHAQAAKAIRNQLKSIGLAARVRSSSYSMGNSVDVEITDQQPKVAALVKQLCNRYQYGHFDGMTDSYEYSNKREGLPQVQFVHVTNTLSPGMRQEIWAHLRAEYVGYLPMLYTPAYANSNRIFDEYIDQFVYRLFTDQNSTFWQNCKKEAA